MAKPNLGDKQAWGTWEDLLLAFAVSHHGTANWDSVAADLRKRAAASSPLTPLSCKLKFLDLRRRFSDAAVSKEGPPVSVPFLDELRRLRIDELRRELHRYDVSIVSLETKVVRLKEERDQSLRPTDDESAKKPDLDREEEAVKASGEGSVHDERSENESNSSDLKIGGANAAEKEPDRTEPVGDEKPREECSGGSSETTAKGSAAADSKPEKLGGESEEEGTKEVWSGEVQSGEVQSSRSESGQAEPEGEDRSVEIKRAHCDVESEPLVAFLEILRSHKFGSIFERRLEIQETPSYNTMIKRHVDFETIRSWAKDGRYSNSKSEFFRDLMLVFTNASVFFGKKSLESAAVAALRLLVLKEMTTQTTTTSTTITTTTTTTTNEQEEEKEKTPDTKPDPPPKAPAVSLARKPKMSVPMNACRKRSSIALRTTAPEPKSGGLSYKKGEKAAAAAETAHEEEEEEEMTPSSPPPSPLVAAKKKGRKDRARISAAESKKKRNNESSASRLEKEKSGKKQSATDFLNRMKRGSAESSTKSGGGIRRKERPVRKGSAAKEQESPARKTAGRPAKKSPVKRSRPGSGGGSSEVGGPKKRARK